jgi:hypothetical protein
MQAPDVRCEGLVVDPLFCGCATGANEMITVGSSCSAVPNEPNDPDGVNAAIRCSSSIFPTLRSERARPAFHPPGASLVALSGGRVPRSRIGAERVSHAI